MGQAALGAWRARSGALRHASGGGAPRCSRRRLAAPRKVRGRGGALASAPQPSARRQRARAGPRPRNRRVCARVGAPPLSARCA